MSRTIREVRVIGKRPEEIQERISDWFAQNRFEVKEWNSNGTPFTVRRWWL